MAAYINSGLMRKYTQPTPPRTITEAMDVYSYIADKIDEDVDFRCRRGRHGTGPMTDEGRVLHEIASKLWAAYYRMDAAVNTEYHRFWGLT
jgi:hypothetical protein